MFNRIFAKLKSEKGAMDRILVTLLFVVIGIAALVSVEIWVSDNKNTMIDRANVGINNIVDNS
ncbi:hypothetical protein [Arcobacter sp. LA11]|uniref:hypothetical protein n=1 Tax=Arcobacter sp. LA11 TaxID=1898176 RepID=UPI0009334BC4|nr:hypothetical protein [Arcobacter sp. LA11]